MGRGGELGAVVRLAPLAQLGEVSLDLDSGVGVVPSVPAQGQGQEVMGKRAHSGRAVHARDKASWTSSRLLVAFALTNRGADAIACWTELWRLGNPTRLDSPNSLERGDRSLP